jgi:glutamate racemase
MDGRPIAIFDSGMGGLTVLHECLVTMPNEDFVYLGDTGRFPYGPRPLEEIRGFALEIGRFLERQGVKMVVVACNSATSAALAHLQAELEVPVVGVIAPEAEAAVQATRNRRIGLLATEATVEAGRYATLIRSLDAGVSFFPLACPGLAELIESDTPYGAGTVEAVRAYAAPLKKEEVDTVILGCTHYPLIRHVLERAFGVAETLARKGFARTGEREGVCRFITTGEPEQFRLMGERFLQFPIADVEAISLAELGAVA